MNETLDPTNIKILQLLQQDARLELQDISARVHKSTSSVHERIRKLQTEGYIKGYVAILDGSKIGRSLLAITQVRLNSHSREVLDSFAAQMDTLPEVLQCLHLAGVCDFMLRVAVADAPTYYEFLMDKICRRPEVLNVETCFVLKECKTHSPYEL